MLPMHRCFEKGIYLSYIYSYICFRSRLEAFRLRDSFLVPRLVV
jgi:hypothetical protein